METIQIHQDNKKTDLDNVKSQLFNEMNKSTHVIKTTCLNHNGKEKTLFSFVDGTNKAGWFDDLFKDTDNKFVANGGVFGRLEEISANIDNVFKQDKSIKEYQTTVYGLNPFRVYIDFKKQLK